MGKNILVAHGGGPTPVMNCSLRGVIDGFRKAGTKGHLYAARFGAEGILGDDLINLTNLSDRQIELLYATPSSAIGSCRRKLSDADYPRIIEVLKKHDIGCLLYNGGNDSMDTCNKLSVMASQSGMDLGVMGIPKTIDNDLEFTDHSPGYGSAARFAAIAAAEIGADASALPIHVVVMECMGRNAGWITASASLGSRISGCGMMTLLPEIPFDRDSFLKEVEKQYRKGHGLLVAVSEGLCGKDGKPVADSGIVDGFGHVIPGGTAQSLSELIIREAGIKARAEKPGLLGRASIPYRSSKDAEEAYEVGKEAVRAALAGITGFMICINSDRSRGYSFTLGKASLADVANVEKKFPLEWIEGAYGISDEFFKYASPLIGELPEFAILR